jgi:hypothetical protein
LEFVEESIAGEKSSQRDSAETATGFPEHFPASATAKLVVD